MRKKLTETINGNRKKIFIVDDEQGVIDSLTVVLKRNGYDIFGTINPVEAIETLKKEHFDMLILDFLMFPIHGDEVVRQLREFNKDIYILLLTGHKDLAPPLETIRKLDIQGYCEKSDKFDQLILLVESGIKAICQMNTVKEMKDGLNKILYSVPKIYQIQPIEDILENILTELLHLKNSEDAFIILNSIYYDPEYEKDKSEKKTIYRGVGKYKTDISSFVKKITSDYFGNIGKSKINPDPVELDCGIIIPLTDETDKTRQPMGILYIEGENIYQDIEILKVYTNQVAASLKNIFLHLIVNVKNQELTSAYQLMRTRYIDTIEALRLMVDAKDVYTRGHSDRVSYYSQKIGAELNLTKNELENLRIGGLFHDVGKIATSDGILLKNERLTDSEFEEIKKHPVKGAQILSAVSMFKSIVPLVKEHHERLDGNGYPDRLKGEQICFLSKIITVADAFDAMMSDRAYRHKLTLNDSINQLSKGIDIQFDRKIVTSFLKILKNYGDFMVEMESETRLTF